MHEMWCMKKFQSYLLGVMLCLSACQERNEKTVRIQTSCGTIQVRLYDETKLHQKNFEKLVQEGFYDGVLFHRVIQDFMIQAGDPDSKHARPEMVLGASDVGYKLEAEIFPRFFHKRGALAAARESDNVNPQRQSSGSHFYIVQGKVYTSEELDHTVESINNRRYEALFNRLKKLREGEIVRAQIAGDYTCLMRINEELSQETRKEFDKVKLVLSEEQKKAYTTIGGTPHLDGEYTVFGEVVEGMEVVDQIAACPVDGNFRPEQDVVIVKMQIEK